MHRHTNENKFIAFGVFFDTQAGGDKENEFIRSLRIGSANNTLINSIPAMNMIRNLNMN